MQRDETSRRREKGEGQRMPRQQVYGKRTRAIYDPRAAFSSPEQAHPLPLPLPTTCTSRATNIEHATQSTRNIVREIDNTKDVQEDATSPGRQARRALGEKHANSVVLPVIAISTAREGHQKQTAAPRQPYDNNGGGGDDDDDDDDDARPHATRHKINRYGIVAAPRQHTTFDDHHHPQPMPVSPIQAERRIQVPTEDTRISRAVRRCRKSFPGSSDASATGSPPRRKQGQHIVFEDKSEQLQAQNTEEICLPTESDTVSRFPTSSKTTKRQNLARTPEVTEGMAQAEGDFAKATCPYHQHCTELLELSAHPLTCFDTWSSELSEHFGVTKIAEASFGEVYRLSLLEDISGFYSTDESVFKVIPLQSPEQTLPRDKRRRAAAVKRNEDMSSPSDVATEVRLLQRMSTIPGFTNFRDVRILQGRPPPVFVDAFKTWNLSQKAKKKDTSHFPDPSKKSSYANEQLWAVIEMQDAGNDLERLVEQGSCTSIWTVWDIFWQTVLSIAKGEEGAEFEHRDLHTGNICIRLASSSSPDYFNEINPGKKLNFTSLETTIIDYTISRCLLSTSHVAYTDLSADSQAGVFEADSTEEYQYDIYRYMRGALYFDNAYAECYDMTQQQFAETGRSWEQFHPQTNLVWLHLVLYKLLEQMEWPSSASKKGPPRRKRKEHAVWKRAHDLEHVLLKLQDLLDPGAICENGIRSASDLVGFAVGERWLDLEDVIGNGVDESALISQLEALELS